MTVRIMVGDAREMLATLPSACIDLTVTSPPYDALRKYAGYTFDFDGVANELHRVTKVGGVVVWVVADQTVDGSETGTSFRQALRFKDIGFNLYDTMIWHKTNPMPTDRVRYQSSFEYMFVLSKGKPRTTNILTEPAKLSGHSRMKHDRTPDGVRFDRPKSYVYGNVRRRHNCWDIGVGGDIKGHPAVFPKQLAADHITSWSNPGDTILDPFFGAGTTALVATDRHCIGIDINPDYADLASARLTAAGLTVHIDRPSEPATALEAAE